MGLLSRFIHVVRAQLNALLTRAEDPGRMLEQTLLDMEQAYRKAKEQVARAVADNKRLEHGLAEQHALVEQWSDRARVAVERDDDDLARDALRRKQEHQRMAQQYEQELSAHTANVGHLKEGLRDLEERIAEVRRRKALLLSRQRRAEAQDQITRVAEGIRDTGALDTLARVEERIDEMSRLADARVALNNELPGDRLEKRFEELDRGGDVEAELLELKEQRRLAGPGGS